MIKGLIKLFIGLMAFTWLARRFLRCRIPHEETESATSDSGRDWDRQAWPQVRRTASRQMDAQERERACRGAGRGRHWWSADDQLITIWPSRSAKCNAQDYAQDYVIYQEQPNFLFPDIPSVQGFFLEEKGAFHCFLVRQKKG